MNNRSDQPHLGPILFATLLLAFTPATWASGGLKSAAQKAPDGRPTPSHQIISGSGISVSYTVAPEPRPGSPFSIRLDLTGVRSPAGATMSVVPETGLEIEGPRAMDLSFGSPNVLVVPARVASEGVFFLNVFTSQDNRKGEQSLLIKVGAGQLRTEKAGVIKTTPEGEKVISMPSK